MNHELLFPFRLVQANGGGSALVVMVATSVA